MSKKEITIKLWVDDSPRMTISYENPELMFEGNGFSQLQFEKMLSDYFKRHDIPVAVKKAVGTLLTQLSSAVSKLEAPSYDEIKEGVLNDMNRLYNTDRILKRGKYSETPVLGEQSI